MVNNFSWCRLFFVGACLSFLAGCTGNAPVYNIGNQAPANGHVVRKGDTLYSIAFRYRLDYKSLASINAIKQPYTIFPGQKLKLLGARQMPDKDGAPEKAKPAAKRGLASQVKSRPAPSPPRVAIIWHWPLEGRSIGGFSLSAPVNKGIDIEGRAGSDVLAAADGAVVYAGGNLRSYGKLVIIKHNDIYLSAYGNNAKIWVKEGDRVKAGRKIAKVGKNSSGVRLLHFEIREKGIPKNPINYLPRRNDR